MTTVPAKRAPDRSRPLQVTGRLKVALDAMVWEGLQYADAAKFAGLTARAMRKALDKSHVCRYLSNGKAALRASEGPRILKRLVVLAHQDRNANAAVAACRAIEHIPESEQSQRIGPQMPGFVLIFHEGGPVSSPVVIDASRADDAPSAASESLVRQIARDR